MKNIYTVLLIFLIAPMVYGQRLTEVWFKQPSPEDSAKVEANRKSVTMKRIPAARIDETPVIDGFPDLLYLSSSEIIFDMDVVPDGNNHFDPANQDPNYKAKGYVMYDDNYIYMYVITTGDDNVTIFDKFEMMFQNTNGGRNNPAITDRCEDDFPGYGQWYWLEDGDGKYVFPQNKQARINVLDTDLDGDCSTPEAQEVDLSSYLVLESLGTIYFEPYANADTLAYEMAFSITDFFGFDAVPNQGHVSGFDMQPRDYDVEGTRDGHLNWNDGYGADNPSSGDWAWAWTPAMGKLIWGDEFIVDIDPLSIKSAISSMNNVNIFPNPAFNTLNITANVNISKVEIHNVVGQLVQTEYNFNNSINISSLNTGIYFVNIYADDALIGTQKLIKK